MTTPKNTTKPTEPNKQQLRVEERERAVKVAHNMRYEQGQSLREIAEMLGKSLATVRGYFYDPTGEKNRALKERYRGTCTNCGNPTSSGDGKGRARELCNTCKGALIRRWDRDSVLTALLRWHTETGKLPSSYDLNPTFAKRRSGEHLERLSSGEYPTAATVREVFGSFQQAKQRAEEELPPAT